MTSSETLRELLERIELTPPRQPASAQRAPFGVNGIEALRQLLQERAHDAA